MIYPLKLFQVCNLKNVGLLNNFKSKRICNTIYIKCTTQFLLFFAVIEYLKDVV